ncbi:unnamed protein product [Camellia sinensis]
MSGRTCVVNVGQSEAGGSSGVAEELATTRVPLNGQRCGRLWAVGIDGEVVAEKRGQQLGSRRLQQVAAGVVPRSGVSKAQMLHYWAKMKYRQQWCRSSVMVMASGVIAAAMIFNGMQKQDATLVL